MKPTVKIYAKDLESSAQVQVKALAEIEGVSKSDILIMPNGHAGSGCVVGTVCMVVLGRLNWNWASPKSSLTML